MCIHHRKRELSCSSPESVEADYSLTAYEPRSKLCVNRPTGRSVATVQLPLRASMAVQNETTRDRILEAAEDAFGEQGYHETLVDDIAGRTSLSKGGFYFHFPSKEDLFFSVIDRLANRLTIRAEGAAAKCASPLVGVEAALTEVLTRLGRRRRIAKVLLVQGYSMGSAFEKKRVEVYGQFAAVIQDGLDRAVVAGEISPINTAVVARAWLGAVNEIVVNWVYRGSPTPTEALPVLRAILIGGLERPDSSLVTETEGNDD